MENGNKQRFVIRAPIERGKGRSGKTFWRDIGSLWLKQEGGEVKSVSISLEVLPIGDGFLQAYPAEDERSKAGAEPT